MSTQIQTQTQPIYENDPTYKIRNYFDGLFEDGCLWSTQYGTFTKHEADVKPNKIWLNTNYKILLNRVDNYILFAIVPQDISETNNYDGFACSYGELTNIPNEVTEKYQLPMFIFNRAVNNDEMVCYIE
jgi:hypothetical protein